MKTFEVLEIRSGMADYLKEITIHNYALNFYEADYIEVSMYAGGPTRLPTSKGITRITFFNDDEAILFQLKYYKYIQFISGEE